MTATTTTTAPSTTSSDALLVACDHEIALCHQMNTGGDAIYSRAGFGQAGRGVVATIIGDGVHARGAVGEIRARYDGWALAAHLDGRVELGHQLRELAGRVGDGPANITLADALAAFQSARALIAAA